MKSLIQKGMGFKKAQSMIAKKQGLPKERAGAILAAGARAASPKAKAENPNLKKVLMAKKLSGSPIAKKVAPMMMRAMKKK